MEIMINMTSIFDLHVEIVKLLQERGEPVYNPCKRSMARVSGVPDVYVKGRPFHSKDFICGFAIKEDKGTYAIHGDFMSYCYAGFKLEELGLCDPACFYDNGKEIIPTIKNDITSKCPMCGQEIKKEG